MMNPWHIQSGEPQYDSFVNFVAKGCFFFFIYIFNLKKNCKQFSAVALVVSPKPHEESSNMSIPRSI